MARDESKDQAKFESRFQIQRLKRERDRRWRKLARADLRALAADAEGMDLLAKAIQAILRQDKSTGTSRKRKKK